MKKIVLAALSILLLSTSFATGKNPKQKDKSKQEKCCDKGSCNKTTDGKTCCL